MLKVLASLAIVGAWAATDGGALTVPGCECPLSACCDWLADGRDRDAVPVSCLLVLQPPLIDLDAICEDVAAGARDDAALSVCDLDEVKEGPLTAMSTIQGSACAPRDCIVARLRSAHDTSLDYNLPIGESPAQCSTTCSRGVCTAATYVCDTDTNAIPFNIVKSPGEFNIDDPHTDKTCPAPAGSGRPNVLFGAPQARSPPPGSQAGAVSGMTYGTEGAMGLCKDVEGESGEILGSIVTTVTGPFPCKETAPPEEAEHCHGNDCHAHHDHGAPSESPSDGAAATKAPLLAAALALALV